MPIYEYQCQECGHLFDALQKMSDEPLTECPDCGEPALRKLLSAPNFRLKGGGWYETDFKGKDKRNLAGDGAKDADKSAAYYDVLASGPKQRSWNHRLRGWVFAGKVRSYGIRLDDGMNDGVERHHPELVAMLDSVRGN